MRIRNIVFALLLSINFAQAAGVDSLIPSLESFFADIYAGTSAFEISDQEKEAMKKSGNAPTYGELTPAGVRIVVDYMLARLNIFFGDDKMPDNLVFIDVGSGAGKVTFGACIEGHFSKCIGVEYSKERHAIAIQANQKMMSGWSSMLPDGCKIALVNEDALKTDVSGIHAIYVSSLCFESEFMKKLLAKFEKELPDGAVIITSKAFQTTNEGRMKLIRRFTLPQTWKADSKAHAYQMGLKGIVEVKVG